jgi:hypothetical protein
VRARDAPAASLAQSIQRARVSSVRHRVPRLGAVAAGPSNSAGADGGTAAEGGRSSGRVCCCFQSRSAGGHSTARSISLRLRAAGVGLSPSGSGPRRSTRLPTSAAESRHAGYRSLARLRASVSQSIAEPGPAGACMGITDDRDSFCGECVNAHVQMRFQAAAASRLQRP